MSLVAKARTLAADLPVHRTAHDTHKQLDASVIAALRAHGILDALVPDELGGHELDPAAYVELLEALAVGDAATAWCTMTSTSTALLAAYLPRATAEAIWGNRQAPFCAGIFAPAGALVDGALSGKWSYGSGSRHADWFLLGAIAGKRHVVCMVPRREVAIVDNWNTLGLAGTGSHDVAVERAQVPAEHATDVFTQAPWAAGALYRVPLFGLLALGVAGCALGIARSALGHLRTRLATDAASSTTLHRYAELAATLESSRAYVLAEAHRVYERASQGPLDAAARGAMRLAASYAAERCAEVARGAFQLVGGAAARTGHPVGNAMHDLDVLCTHRMVQSRVWPAAARAVLGMDGVPPDL